MSADARRELRDYLRSLGDPVAQVAEVVTDTDPAAFDSFVPVLVYLVKRTIYGQKPGEDGSVGLGSPSKSDSRGSGREFHPPAPAANRAQPEEIVSTDDDHSSN